MNPRLVVCAVYLMFAGTCWAQSADQEVVSVVDSADPVVPGQNVSYTVVVRNNGPDAAANGGINVNLGSALTYLGNTVPPGGWQCFVSGNNVSCINPSFAAGTTATITLLTQMAPHLINFPDGSTASNFFPSGVTPDPNNANNFRSETTAWDSPQVDLAISVTDTPEPVGPDQDLSYTATVTNTGADAATSVNFGVYNAGYVPFESVTPPAGWTCMPPAVGAAMIFNCTTPSFAAGANSEFTVVARVDDAILGINDGTISTAFSVGGTGDDTNDSNNIETENTAYVTPDADLAITVIDQPDPVILGQSFQYLVTMTHLGPDAAANATMTMNNSGSLRFQQVLAPAGYVCTIPSVGAAPILSCQTTSMASGSSADFVVTVLTDVNLMGEQGGMVASNFSATANTVDPNNANNAQVVSTLVAPDVLFRDGFE